MAGENPPNKKANEWDVGKLSRVCHGLRGWSQIEFHPLLLLFHHDYHRIASVDCSSCVEGFLVFMGMRTVHQAPGQSCGLPMRYVGRGRTQGLVGGTPCDGTSAGRGSVKT